MFALVAAAAPSLLGSRTPAPKPTVAFYPGAGSPSEVGGTGLPGASRPTRRPALSLTTHARTHTHTKSVAGDIGFDPLGLANFDLLLDSGIDKQRSAALVLRDYRDAELKHGRLAMLAAVAWPLQEKLNPLLAARFHMPNLVAETGGLSPSVLNGGLEQGIIPSAVVTFAVLVSLVEAQGLRIKKAQGEAWMPGDYTTARIAERGSPQFFSLQEGEIWNSRIAMLAVLAYVVQEVASGIPTAATIPFWGF